MISSDVADIRLFSFTAAKGSISTPLFASILKLVLNVSILSLKNLLNRLANSKLVSWVGRVAACWFLMTLTLNRWIKIDIARCF